MPLCTSSVAAQPGASKFLLRPLNWSAGFLNFNTARKELSDEVEVVSSADVHVVSAAGRLRQQVRGTGAVFRVPQGLQHPQGRQVTDRSAGDALGQARLRCWPV
ncbi:hypothetical protein FQZ97_1217830 [compost metagenome]